jgi:hypothetical protein
MTCCHHQKCSYCGKLVNITRWLFPGWHLCLSSEEREQIDYQRQLQFHYDLSPLRIIEQCRQFTQPQYPEEK